MLSEKLAFKVLSFLINVTSELIFKVNISGSPFLFLDDIELF